MGLFTVDDIMTGFDIICLSMNHSIKNPLWIYTWYGCVALENNENPRWFAIYCSLMTGKLK